jgi:hypothetical protein
MTIFEAVYHREPASCPALVFLLVAFFCILTYVTIKS